MVGFVQSIPRITGEHGTMSAHKAQCFFANKLKASNVEKDNETNSGFIKFAEITAHHADAEVVNLQ